MADITTELSQMLQRLAASPGVGVPMVLYTNTTQVGNVLGGTDDLMTYAMPANTLNTDGQALRITAWGSCAANGNTKTLTLLFGAMSVNTYSTTDNNVKWSWTATIVRTGAATQISISDAVNGSTLRSSLTAAGTETLSGAVTVKMTGASASSASDDLIQLGMIIEWLPVGASA